METITLETLKQKIYDTHIINDSDDYCIKAKTYACRNILYAIVAVWGRLFKNKHIDDKNDTYISSILNLTTKLTNLKIPAEQSLNDTDLEDLHTLAKQPESSAENVARLAKNATESEKYQIHTEKYPIHTANYARNVASHALYTLSAVKHFEKKSEFGLTDAEFGLTDAEFTATYAATFAKKCSIRTVNNVESAKVAKVAEFTVKTSSSSSFVVSNTVYTITHLPVEEFNSYATTFESKYIPNADCTLKNANIALNYLIMAYHCMTA
jgi:hypothetical protein